jgi:hypothetical protein
MIWPLATEIGVMLVDVIVPPKSLPLPAPVAVDVKHEAGVTVDIVVG